MRNFLYKMQNALMRFMYGRNGADQLNNALLVSYLAVWLLGNLLTVITKSALLANIVNILMTALAVVIVLRMLSRNLAKRRAENAKFLAWWYPTKNRLKGMKQRYADKDHKYFTCKSCKTVCRVPAGRGKIVITCPKCGAKIHGKS